MRVVPMTWVAVALCLTVSSAFAPPLAVGASAQAVATRSVAATTPAQTPLTQRRPRWAPRSGVIFNDPTVPSRRRVILGTVIRSIQGTPATGTIRLVVWNFDDRPMARTLLGARKRGVTVQVVVAGSVDNHNWNVLKAGLTRNTKDDSWARKCKGACRSTSKIMHSKIFLFSRVGDARTISMFGSSNLTTPAGNRQWNDQVVTKSKRLYDYFVKTFKQYAADKPVKRQHDGYLSKRFRVTLFPVHDVNPVAQDLSKVKCRGVTGGTGNPNGRTVVRIAIAGWFDAYGNDIATKVSQLWDRGCDVKIITTLAGRGVNKILRNSRRGPVPIRQLSIDNNEDGIPDRYLHMKSISISGVYGSDNSASVVLTGSPNWSTRAQHSDEVWVRILDARMARQYARHVDRLYASRSASPKLLSRAQLLERMSPGLGRRTAPPAWFELD